MKLSQNKENDNARIFLEWMRKCYVGNGVELVGWTERFAGIGRENQKHFVRYALHFMHEYRMIKVAGKEAVRLQAVELKTAQNLKKVIEFEQIRQITKLLDDCFYYIERNANPKILFLDASLKMNRILKNRVMVEN